MLLRDLPQSEFPAEYLVPRLLARNGAAATGVQDCLAGKKPVAWATDQEITGELLATRFWLYRQLHSRLRQDLGPVFLFSELKTLINWLRIRQAHASDALLHSLLSHSLLCPELQQALREETEAEPLAARLDTILCSRLDPAFSGIAARYSKNGLPDFEKRLYQLFFEHIGLTAANAVVRSFFKGVADQRNILAFAKASHWKDQPFFLPGGHLALNWEKAWAEPERADRLLTRLHWESGLPQGAKELSGLEDFLLRRQSLLLHRQARNGTVERIIHFLWQQDIHAGNMGLLLHGRLVGAEMLAAKVVQ
ncbi:MAG: hypothetical protein KKH22_04310 [Proteobacteria bacterium]|nr:hypothetical protein [Pseudomonadota bacterium]